MIKGFILSTGVLALIFCCFYFFIDSKTGSGPSNFFEAILPLLIISPFVLGAGGAVGYFAEHHIFSGNMSRFMQIFSFSMCIYVIVAILIGILMIFTDGSYPGGILAKIGGGLALGGMGALLFALFFIPLIAVLSYILSRWIS